MNFQLPVPFLSYVKPNSINEKDNQGYRLMKTGTVSLTDLSEVKLILNQMSLWPEKDERCFHLSQSRILKTLNHFIHPWFCPENLSSVCD